MRERAVFIDRDGTINRETGYVHTVEAFEFLPGVLAALQRLSAQQVKIFVVTNQSGIARGYYTESDFQRVTQHMLASCAAAGITIEAVLYCPHHPDGIVPEYTKTCDCRKPGSALLAQAMAAHHLAAADTAIIGDKNSDVDAGRALQLRTYLVATGYGIAEQQATHADWVVPDLGAAVDHLLHTWGATS